MNFKELTSQLDNISGAELGSASDEIGKAFFRPRSCRKGPDTRADDWEFKEVPSVGFSKASFVLTRVSTSSPKGFGFRAYVSAIEVERQSDFTPDGVATKVRKSIRYVVTY